MIFKLEHSINQKIYLPEEKAIELFIKREDRIHSFVSGNKYRKLKYNLIEAESKGIKTLLTFGGAFSNHIAAVAAAGKDLGFKTIGVIRGEELANKITDNPTLSFAKGCGMVFKFVSRATYRTKATESFIDRFKRRIWDLLLNSRRRYKYSGC